MTAENPLANQQPASDSEATLNVKETILAAWQQLPDEHQATMALVLLEGLMKSEQRPWFQEAMALRWPLETALLPTTFPIVQITRDDLVTACFIEDEIAQLTDDDLGRIGQTMRDHYVHDVFWPELEYVVTDLLEKKRQQTLREVVEETKAVDGEYYSWMNEIDRHVWMLVGCSVYDLPDFDSRSMFEIGMTAAEVTNEVLKEAGFVPSN